jgi:raffinose/stachyose/melibiose transport system permease protein
MMNKSLKRWFPLFLLPTLIAFLIGFVIPFFMGLYLSFCEYITIEEPTFVGFANYVRVFTQDSTFWYSLGFTSLFTLVSVLLINLAAFAVALALTRGIRGTNLFRTVFFMPNLIGGIVLGYIWKMIINYGVLIPLYGKDLSYDSAFGFWSLVIVLAWQQIGYMMVIYVSGLQAVPEELLEAAKIDGAGRWQVLRRVTIPMVMPSITICTFLTLTNSFKLYDQNLALTDGKPGRLTEMLAMAIRNAYGVTAKSHGTAQAMAVLFFIIVAAIALFQLIATHRKEVRQ